MSCDTCGVAELNYSKEEFFYDNKKSIDTSDHNTPFTEKKEGSIELATTISISVFDVAAYILDKLGNMTTMKLQKLVYYSQAWSLVWDEKPLFPEPIEAWANGPVVKKLFAFHRGQYEIDFMPIGNKDLLSKEETDTIDSVLEFYGDKKSQWLIQLSHMEEPWKNARLGMTDMDRGNKKVKLSDMAEYYSSL